MEFTIERDNEVPESFSDYFGALYNEALAIMVERQGGYGPTNIESLGAYGVFSRLSSDKCSRVSNALNGVIVNGEAHVSEDWYNDGVRDALIDIANYALILVALGEDQWSGISRGHHADEGFVNDSEGEEPEDDGFVNYFEFQTEL
jgi:hypothetical protein